MVPSSAPIGVVDVILAPAGLEHRVVRAACNANAAGAPAVHAIPLGPAAVAAQLRQWLAAGTVFPPGSRILLMGLGGALAEGLQVGEAVLMQDCGQLPEASDIRWLFGHRELNAALRRAAPALRPVRLLTSTTVVCSRREKLELHQRTGADVVDMEGFPAMEMLSAAGHRLAIVRVVSDDSHHDLPDLSAVISASGSLRSGPLLLAFLKRPLGALRMIRGCFQALRVLGGLTHQLLDSEAQRAA
jgi:nucleoside phosphorylase